METGEWHRLNGENLSLTARKLGVDRKRVREWERPYDKLLPLCHGKCIKVCFVVFSWISLTRHTNYQVERV